MKRTLPVKAGAHKHDKPSARSWNVVEFDYSLGEDVRIKTSGALGTVIACAAYEDGEKLFLVRYRDADGIPCEVWWNENLLEGAR